MSASRPGSGPSRRVVEFDLDLFRLSALILVTLIVVLVVYWLGRASVVDQSDAARAAMQTSPTRAEHQVEDVEESQSVFDRVDAEQPRESRRQTTEELSRTGQITLPVRRSKSRGSLDRLARRIEALGYPSVITRSSDGSYELSAGPFRDLPRAQRAAERLTSELGQKIPTPEAGGE